MMDIALIDLTMQFRHAPDPALLAGLEQSLHELDGVISTHPSRHNPRLMLVEINPQRIDADTVLHHVSHQGMQADWVVPDRL